MPTLQEVKDQIDEFFSDTSRSKRETVEGLEEIVEHTEVSIGVLKDEIKKEGG